MEPATAFNLTEIVPDNKLLIKKSRDPFVICVRLSDPKNEDTPVVCLFLHRNTKMGYHLSNEFVVFSDVMTFSSIHAAEVFVQSLHSHSSCMNLPKLINEYRIHHKGEPLDPEIEWQVDCDVMTREIESAVRKYRFSCVDNCDTEGVR